MININRSQIQSLKLSQNDNQASMHREGIVNVLGVAGSMREQSYSTRGLKMVLEETKKYNAESYMLEVRKINLPLYDPSEITSDNSSSNNNNVLERITTALRWADVFAIRNPPPMGQTNKGFWITNPKSNPCHIRNNGSQTNLSKQSGP